jgi:hypothetical protein
MFSYAFGQENLLCDKRHSAGSPSMSDFEKIFTSCGKVTSLSLSVNAISPENPANRRLFIQSVPREGTSPTVLAQSPRSMTSTSILSEIKK